DGAGLGGLRAKARLGRVGFKGAHIAIVGAKVAAVFGAGVAALVLVVHDGRSADSIVALVDGVAAHIGLHGEHRGNGAAIEAGTAQVGAAAALVAVAAAN